MNPIEAGAHAYDQSSPCKAHMPKAGHYRAREWTCVDCKHIRIRAAAIAMVGELSDEQCISMRERLCAASGAVVDVATEVRAELTKRLTE